MRASSPSVTHSFVVGLRLFLGRNTKFQFLTLRSLTSTCLSFLENEVATLENCISFDENSLQNFECISVDSSDHSRFYLCGKGIREPVKWDPSGFESWGMEDEMKKVKSILSKRGWYFGSGNRNKIDLDELNVTRILNDLFEETSDAALAFCFFMWCEDCTGTKHAVLSVCTMVNILVSGNMNYRAMDLLLYNVKNADGGEEWHNLIFNVLKETSKNKKILEIVYSMLVGCYVKEDMVNLAIEVVHKMKNLGFFPPPGVCNSLLKALLKSRKIDLAWEIFGEVQNRGMGFNASIISLFIHEYCALGMLGRACELLVDMRGYGLQPDVVAYTIVIDAFCKLGYLKEATSILFKIIEMNIFPDSVLVSSVVDGYCKAGRLEEAMVVLEVFGFAPNLFIYNSFIATLFRDGRLSEANAVFSEMLALRMFPDCYSYTTIIRGYCKAGDMRTTLNYFGRMLKTGIEPSIVTYTVLIEAYCKSGDMETAEYFFQVMARKGLKPDIFAYNTLIDGYGKVGHLHQAFRLLEIMKSADVSPDITTYNIIIHGLVKRGFVKESRDMLDELIRRGFSPNVFTFTDVLSGFSKGGCFEEAFLVWSYMNEHEMRPDVVTCSALLNGYCKAHLMDEANALFQKMLDAGLIPDLILYNTLIHGFCSMGNINDACHLLSMMVERGVIPNNDTYRLLTLGFEKNCVDDPIKASGIKMRQILLKHGYNIDISQDLRAIARLLAGAKPKAIQQSSAGSRWIHFYCQGIAHPAAKNFKCVSYDRYKKMGIVIGNDQPTGSSSMIELDFEVDDGQEDIVSDGVEAYNPSIVDQYFEDVSEAAVSMSTQCNLGRAESNIGSSSKKHRKKARVNDDVVDILGVMGSKIGKLAEALIQGEESAFTFSDRLYKEVMKIDNIDYEMLDDVFGVLNDNDKFVRGFFLQG
ncbi:hypothetical protein NE237_007513 [Protea cynaroides]|uniref:Pentatricopeptide repeat-containing protein n=1 Tax=Protea cynaroides TaxID=273540 RepID=A0A9Q0QWK5_9MAGN|nr:hypothetical protein NE237_007513 [Protea cynaroides]